MSFIRKFFNEFKEFAIKGNVIDLAVGVIIGGAFSKIVSSLVNDIFMPIITLITGKTSFENLFIALDGKKYDTIEMAQSAGVGTVNIGIFISNVVDFLLIAFVIFVLVKQINRFKRKSEPVPATTKECPFCRTSIHIEATKCPNCTSDLS